MRGVWNVSIGKIGGIGWGFFMTIRPNCFDIPINLTFLSQWGVPGKWPPGGASVTKRDNKLCSLGSRTKIAFIGI